MKTLRNTICLLVMALCCSCTQNNGHIGRLFGAWVLTDCTVDGTSEGTQPGVTSYMSFQGDVVTFTQEYPYHDYTVNAATWQRSGDRLVINFNNSSDNAAPGTGGFGPPAWLPAEDLRASFTILRLDGSRMTLSLDTASGTEIIYQFERTW